MEMKREPSIISKKIKVPTKTDKKISFNIESLSTNSGIKFEKGHYKTMTMRNVYENMKSESDPLNIITGRTVNERLERIERTKSIKQEIIKDIGKKITHLSPENKHFQGIPILGGLPKIRSCEKSSFFSGSSNSVSLVQKRLTKKKIESEKKLLKTFMQRSIFGLDEQTLNRNLKIPPVNKHAATFQEFMLTRGLDRQQKNRKGNDTERMKKLEAKAVNPSFGPEYLKRKFKNTVPKEKLWNFENKFKSKYSKKLLGSILFAKRIQPEDDSNKYDNVKNVKFLQVSKLKMKWKTIKWILDNKRDVLDRLMDFHENILKISDKQAKEDKGLTKGEFVTIMKRNGITNDIGLIHKLFWVFDEDGDNDLRSKEIAFGIEMFRDSSIDQKLKAFFDLCDTDNSGTISKIEFTNLMRKNIINNDEKISMKEVVDKIFSSVKLDEKGEMTFEQLKESCGRNKEIQNIIYKNLLALNSIDNVIDREVKKDIMQFNPELNDNLRMKLLSMRISYIPLREEKFTNLLENFVANKHKVLETLEMNNEEESYELKEEDSSLFQQESDLVKPLMNMSLYKN